MRVNAKLTFNGDCEAAFRLYEQCLSGQITFLQTYGEALHDGAPEEMRTKIIHATLKTANGYLSAADVPPAEYIRPQGFSLQLNVAPGENVLHVYETLCDGGQVLFPLQKTYWSEHYAVVTDRFGISWEINEA